MATPTTTIRQLALLGFILVVLPLALGLVLTVIQVDRLAQETRRLLDDSTAAVASARLVASRALSMERTAEQYLLLGDVALLLGYEKRRQPLHDEIERLQALDPQGTLAPRLDELRDREEALYAMLLDLDENQVGHQTLTPEQRLSPLVRSIPQAGVRLAADNAAALGQQVAALRQRLLWQALALIPLALGIAFLFATLVTRPLRQLGAAIRRLGEGRLDQPVAIRGPRDIRELGEELEWMRRQLAALEEQKLEFLRHVSHELKTPLATLREGTDLLRDEVPGRLNEDQHQVTRILQASARQLQGQVERLLDFNQALARREPAPTRPLPLAPLVEAVAEDHQLAAGARGVAMEMDLDVRACVPGVPDQLRQVVDNLLSNAVKFTPDGGRVRVTLKRQDDQVVLEVANEGDPIPAADRERIFQPFYQGRNAARGPLRGTGLGLSIVHHYVRLHGGEVKLADPDGPPRFQVALPAAPCPDDARSRQ